MSKGFSLHFNFAACKDRSGVVIHKTVKQNSQGGFLNFVGGLSSRVPEVTHSTMAWSKSHFFGYGHKNDSPLKLKDMLYKNN